MKRKKVLIIGVVVLVTIVVFLSTNTYTSSIGLATTEDYKEFSASKPTCYGIDVLLNKEDTWVDAPGVSLCIGYLK